MMKVVLKKKRSKEMKNRSILLPRLQIRSRKRRMIKKLKNRNMQNRNKISVILDILMNLNSSKSFGMIRSTQLLKQSMQRDITHMH
jgi:hypothetical protein